MRQLLIYTLIILAYLPMHGQEGANPFEIQSRLDSVYQSQPASESSAINIFDVIRDDQVIIESNTSVPTQSGDEPISTIIPPVGEDQPINGDEVLTETEDIINPFDVSHIPIRRSKLKKEADAFAPTKSLTSNKTKRERSSSETSSNAFLFWLNLLTGFILAIVINTQSGALTKISKSITNENVLKLNHRNEKRGTAGHYLLLYFSFFINAGIFIYLVIYHFYGMSGWMLFAKCFAGVSVIYLLRHLFLYMVGVSFPVRKEASLYGFTIESFNLFIGIILIPLNLIIAFGPTNIAIPLIYVSMVVVGLLILLRTFRGLLISTSWISSNLIHFFLYLCAFEILPILLLIKVIGKFGTA